jgi:ABC-2 type transport system permease protein
MTRLVGAEVFKLRTTRTFYGLLAGALGLVLLIVILSSSLGKEGDTSMEDVLTSGAFALVFALLLGIISVTAEFRHGTITPTLLVEPDRTRLTISKLLASVLAGLGLVLLLTVVAGLFGWAILSARGFDTSTGGSDTTKEIIGGIVATCLYAALGVGIGALVRNQVGAVIGSLVYLFVLENLLNIAAPLRDPVAKFGFGGLINGLTSTGNSGDDHPPLHQVPAGLVLTAYCAIFVIAGIAVMKKRDITA